MPEVMRKGGEMGPLSALIIADLSREDLRLPVPPGPMHLGQAAFDEWDQRYYH